MLFYFRSYLNYRQFCLSSSSAHRYFTSSLSYGRWFTSPTTKEPEESLNQKVYHAGLRHTIFTSECNINNESQIIPIFRVLAYNGELQGNWKCPFTTEECLKIYRFMVNLSVWDMMLYNVQRQGQSIILRNMVKINGQLVVYWVLLLSVVFFRTSFILYSEPRRGVPSNSNRERLGERGPSLLPISRIGRNHVERIHIDWYS